MDVQEILNHLNRLFDFGDYLDDTVEAGVKALTNGKYTTRETCRLELGQFLLYIANGNGTLNNGETAFINVVLNENYSSSQLKQIASSTDAPNPASSLTLMGFLTGDIAQSQQKGYRTTHATNGLIGTYEAFGNLMVAFDENPVSKARCAKYIDGMKTFVKKNL